jgi:hypothetical protein
MTNPAICVGGSAFSAGVLDLGFSETAERLRAILQDLIDVDRSVTLGEPRDRMSEALNEAFERANRPNWDGEGADPADPLSFKYSCSLVMALPAGVPVPEVSVDPDGEMCLEWDYGARSVFSVSVGRDGTLTYAGLFGTRKRHGVEPFADVVPGVVSGGIFEAVRQPAH